MEHRERNGVIRRKMLEEIADIEAFTTGHSAAELTADRMWQKAVVMSLINIGELTKAFSEDYLAAMPEIPLEIHSRFSQHRRPSVRRHRL